VRSRIAVSAVIAAGVLLGSTGCAFISTVATQIPYDASDGTSTTVGDIKVRNAMAITSDGETVNLVMYVLNSGEKSATVKLQYDYDGDNARSSETIEVPAGQSISFGNGGDSPELVLDEANVALGSLMPIFVQYGDVEGKTIMVPVLDGSLPGYGDLVPTNVPTSEPRITATPDPTSSPTSTSTPEPTETPEADD